MLHDRNDVVLNFVDEHFQTNPMADLVELWGEEHLPGVGDGLVERGFAKVDEQQLIAIHL